MCLTGNAAIYCSCEKCLFWNEKQTTGGIYMRTIVNDSTLGIVDNDPLVASAIQSLLVETCAPIQILWTATSAEQALEAMRDSAQRPQAVLTDIAMPGMNGSELAHHIKEQHPDIAVIGISAFLDDENEKRYGAP